jgi:hypothetical protein
VATTKVFVEVLLPGKWLPGVSLAGGMRARYLLLRAAVLAVYLALVP